MFALQDPTAGTDSSLCHRARSIKDELDSAATVASHLACIKLNYIILDWGNRAHTFITVCTCRFATTRAYSLGCPWVLLVSVPLVPSSAPSVLVSTPLAAKTNVLLLLTKKSSLPNKARWGSDQQTTLNTLSV
jgi:hypothetical protein